MQHMLTIFKFVFLNLNKYFFQNNIKLMSNLGKVSRVLSN